MRDYLALSTKKVDELLNDDTFRQLVRTFGDKIDNAFLPVGTFNSYQVACKDGTLHRFITVYGKDQPSPEIFVMTFEEGLALPKTGEQIRKTFPQFVGMTVEPCTTMTTNGG